MSEYGSKQKESFCGIVRSLRTAMTPMRNSIFFVMLLISLTVVIAAADKGKPMTRSLLVPKEINGWKATEQDRVYGRQTLFDYIDGGAEIYLTYRFREVIVRTLERKEHPNITIEIFDMETPEDAFGIFTFERESPDIEIGQGSEYADGLLRFWKNYYFVSIWTDEENKSSRETIGKLAKQIDRSLPAPTDLGFYLNGEFLPGDGLLRKQIRFFHKKFNLNYHFYLSDQNILNLNEDTDAFLAPYLIGENKSYLLVVRYPDAKKASHSFDQFIDAYMPEVKNQGTALMENKKWTAGAVKSEFVSIIFDSLTEESAQKMVRQTLLNLEQKP
jgi:hypothetical protein